jgi:hypothetical protein
MKRHPFDPLSFAFGLLFLAVGLPLLFTEPGVKDFEGRWILPAFLIVAGVLVLATTRRRMGKREAVMSETDVDDQFDSVVR